MTIATINIIIGEIQTPSIVNNRATLQGFVTSSPPNRNSVELKKLLAFILNRSQRSRNQQ
jgi:hypothetical protein